MKDLDNSMVVAGGSNGPDWNKPDATPEEIAAEEAREKQAAIEREHDAWEKAIKEAKPGDVIVWRDAIGGYTQAMLVQNNYAAQGGQRSVWGVGVLTGKEHALLSVNANSAAPSRSQFDQISALEVVSL